MRLAGAESQTDWEGRGLELALPLSSCVAVGKLLNPSEPHCPHVENRDDNGLFPPGLLGGFPSLRGVCTQMSPLSEAAPGHPVEKNPSSTPRHVSTSPPRLSSWHLPPSNTPCVLLLSCSLSGFHHENFMKIKGLNKGIFVCFAHCLLLA